MSLRPSPRATSRRRSPTWESNRRPPSRCACATPARPAWAPPAGPALAAPERPLEQRQFGEAGVKAQREFERRRRKREQQIEYKWGLLAPIVNWVSTDPEHTVAWAKGADGERRTATVLAELVRSPAVLLHDVAVPRSRANIDHVVIAPNGVWIIDSKALTGSIDIRDGRVFVDGRHRPQLAAGLVWQRDVVLERLGEDVPVWCALAFAGTRQPPQPAEAGGVLCAGPDFLAACINQPGDLDWLTIDRLAQRLHPRRQRAG